MSKIILKNTYADSNFFLTSIIDCLTARIESIVLEGGNNEQNYAISPFKPTSAGVNETNHIPNQIDILKKIFQKKITIVADTQKTPVAVDGFGRWKKFSFTHARAKSVVLTSCLKKDLLEVLKLQITFTVNWLNELIVSVIFENLLIGPQVLQFSFAPPLWIKSTATTEKNASSTKINDKSAEDSFFRWGLDKNKIELASNENFTLLPVTTGERKNEYWYFKEKYFHLSAKEKKRLVFICSFKD